MKAQRFFWPLYLVLLLGAALAGSEAIASFIVPSWPARDMRPIEVAPSPDVAYNDWALRDRPRSFERPADVRFRSILVGDSFLEGVFLRAPLSAFVEQRLAAAGQTDAEAINFGVSATGPRHYYYRIKNVGPDIEAGRHRAGRLRRQRFRPDALRRLDAAADRRAAAALPARRPGAAHDLARRQPPRPLGVRPQQQDHRRRIRPAERVAQAAGRSAARPGRAAPQAELLSRAQRRGDPRDPVARRRQVLDGFCQAAPRPGIPRGLAAVGHDRLGDRHLDHAARRRGGRPPRRHARWSTRR